MGEHGTYTLLIELRSPVDVTFGSKGQRSLPAGWYAYTGSAFGPGGFARLERHRRVAAGDNEARHWHVDYLLGRPESELGGVVRSAGLDAECAIAGAIADAARPVPAVGATDCRCLSHLAHAEAAPPLDRVVRRAHDQCR